MQNETVLKIKECKYNSKEELLNAIAESLHFPSYFGVNYDALEDCLKEFDEPITVEMIHGESGCCTEWGKMVCEIIRDLTARGYNYRLRCVSELPENSVEEPPAPVPETFE